MTPLCSSDSFILYMFTKCFITSNKNIPISIWAVIWLYNVSQVLSRSVLWLMCCPGASGEVHQVCLRNQQHWPAANGAGEQDGEWDDRLRSFGRSHHCWVEGRTEWVLGWPPGADGDPQTDAGSITPAAQVLHWLQRGAIKTNNCLWFRCAMLFSAISKVDSQAVTCGCYF